MRRLPALLALLRAAAAHAQDAATRVNDMQSWVSLGVQHSLRKGTDLSLKYTLRDYGFHSAFKGSYYYLQLRQKLDRHWAVDGQVRVMDSPTANFFRLEGGLRYRAKTGDWTIYTRTAFFNERRQLAFGEHVRNDPTLYWRQRMHASLDLPHKLTAWASAESWIRLNAHQPKVNRVAWMGGVRRGLRKGGEAGLTYLYQPEYTTQPLKSVHALITELEWDLDRLLRKKKGRKKGGGEPDRDGGQ
jgi:hypothetical protein